MHFPKGKGNLHWSHWERDLPATETCKERHSKQKKKHKRKQNRSPGKLEVQGARGRKGRVGGDLAGQEQAGRDYCKRQGEDEGRRQATVGCPSRALGEKKPSYHPCPPTLEQAQSSGEGAGDGSSLHS